MIHHRVVESITKAFFDCILVILLLIVIILTTEVGLKVSVWFIQKSTDNKLSIESIKGSWLSNIEINGLKIKTQNISLLAKHINFSSKLIDLLELNLKLNGLTASDITIELKNLNNSKININNFYDAQSLLEKINIPIDFAANKIDLKNITIKQNSQDNIAIKSIQFQTTISKNILNINKLLIIRAPYKIESNGMILLNKPFDCNINFTVFKNNIHYITADLNGNAKQKLSLKIQSNNQLNLNATFNNLLSRCEFLIDGEWNNFTVPMSSATPFSGDIIAKGTLNNYSSTGHISIPKTQSKSLSASWNITGKLKNISIKNIKISSDNCDFTLTGNLNNYFEKRNIIPTGHINITGNYYITQPELSIKNIKSSLEIFHTSQSTLNGSANINGSVISFNGKINPFTHPLSAIINITGNNIPTLNNDGYSIITSPNLKLTYKYPSFSLNGEILVPKARIKESDLGDVATLPDSVIILQKAHKKENLASTLKELKSIPFQTNIKIILGNDIYINYDGLESNIAGNFIINNRLHRQVTAIGSIYFVNGKYKVYGEELAIDYGRITFTDNPIDAPYINIQASKTVQPSQSATKTTTSVDKILTFQNGSLDQEKITVGIQASGTPGNTRVKLFSAPPGLSHADILSYLILDVPSSEASSQQLSILFKTANELDFQNSPGNIANNIQKSFDLTELGFESSQIINKQTNIETRNTSFVVGKKLGKKLSLTYSIGILVPVNILKLRYILSNNWYLQTESSSEGNGADIFYVFEKD